MTLVKIKTIIFFLIFTTSIIASNQSQLDSLYLVIHQKESHDTTKLKSYVQALELLYTSNIDTLFDITQSIKKIAQPQVTQKKNQKELKVYQESLISAYQSGGYYFLSKGKMQEALEEYEEMRKWSLERKDTASLGTYYLSVGYIYKQQGLIEKSLEAYHQSLICHRDSSQLRNKAITLNNLASLYEAVGNLDDAIFYYRQALLSLSKLNYSSGVSACLSNLGLIMLSKGELDSAINNFNQAIKLFKEVGNKKGLTVALNNVGRCFESQQKIDSATYYFRKSLTIAIENDLKDEKTFPLLNLGKMYFIQNKHEEAKKYVLEVLNLSKNTKNIEASFKAHRLLSSIFKSTKEHEKSLFHFESYITLRDSVNNEQNQKSAIRQQTQYEFEKAQLIKQQQEREKERVEQEEKERRDNIQYSMIFLGILLVFGSILGLGFIKVSPKFAEGLIFFAFLIFFEFCLVLLDPIIDDWSSGEPIYKLLFNALLAGAIFPLHSILENSLKKKIMNKHE
jgi:tetratricopeptide (TPR) repeat protein